VARDQPPAIAVLRWCAACAGAPRDRASVPGTPVRLWRLMAVESSEPRSAEPAKISLIPGGMRPTLSTDGQPESARQEGAVRDFTDELWSAVVCSQGSRQDGGMCLILRQLRSVARLSCLEPFSLPWQWPLIHGSPVMRALVFTN
jgi:hypothetical protein